MLLCGLHMVAESSDSSRYYFKLSYYAGYGIETFDYSTSHRYNEDLRPLGYAYSGGFGNAKIVAPKFSHEIKLDCELPRGIKVVNSISFNSMRFDTPTYDGNLIHGYAPPVYTYKVKEKVYLETINGFFGLGYGRKRKRMIWDGDIGIDIYTQSYLSIKRELDIAGSAGNYPTPQPFAAYSRKALTTLEPELAIKGSFNVSYKLVSFVYLRAGIVYRYDVFGSHQEGPFFSEDQTFKFDRIRTYMLNLGVSFSVK